MPVVDHERQSPGHKDLPQGGVQLDPDNGDGATNMRRFTLGTCPTIDLGRRVLKATGRGGSRVCRVNVMRVHVGRNGGLRYWGEQARETARTFIVGHKRVLRVHLFEETKEIGRVWTQG